MATGLPVLGFGKGSAEQRALCGRTPKSISLCMIIAADAVFVKSELLRVNIEELFLRGPIRAFAAHAIAENTRIEFTVARFTNAVQNAVGFGGQFLAQPLLEVRRDAAGQ